MTFGRTQLGSVELMQSAFSGFDYPENAQITSLLGDGTTPGGNAVLQQSALAFRQATLAWVLDGQTDVDTIRGYAESKESVAYTDHNGASRAVRILNFATTLRVGDFWDCTATLIEEA